ncbi:sigma-70 family RNA polymerase sigma factor [Modestobacter sp. I12A-02628]|uniref:RNA polymerase sigma factor n=1 Tax=Goekera deserti TaxID=2497753 RepID=A0A7K3WFZ7_9ACTN|nr:RNA polymerase sigma factor [Goekera deserti]MPR00389.1 sigma-70 family RNA polymerase sigma factor [Goekera deserti]NDI50407.1 sigma-70 family RNA polymerase sigma factor [Goekera deserti]NEL55327.1 RNA polymerase sigma factor [Goekera deserti]
MRDQPPDDGAVRFTALWEAHAGRVLAYATRHVGAHDAQEVVAETFLVAWRRLADVPGQPLPWLLVVARNTVANHRRSSHRGAVLQGELARLQETAAGAGADVTATDRAAALARLAALSAKEREALLLVNWDGLSPSDAAQVAGCSVSAFHVRLHRARRRLQSGDPDPAHGPDRPLPATPTRRAVRTLR